jgi:enoyl-CoA hydratase/carnithine racemase
MARTTAPPNDDLVLWESHDGVATLTLHRPARLNAWTPALSARYFDLLERADDDPSVRAIVVTGAGRGFTAGADMDVLQGNEAGAQADRRPQTFPLSIRKPILAAVNGPCAGIGLVLALMCDVRFAAAGAKFTTAFARRGLVAEHGSSWILPRLVGHARALDLLLSGRVFLAEEAFALGLVNRVCAPEALLAETHAYAQDLVANCSPAAIAEMKRQVYAAYETDLASAVSTANRLMVESFARPDFKEGVTSFLEKRPPAFPPLPPRRRASSDS